MVNLSTAASWLGLAPVILEARTLWLALRFRRFGRERLIRRPGYEAPAQRVGDFLRGLPTPKGLTHRSTYRPDVFFGDLRETLPDYVAHTLALALPTLDRKLHGFAAPDALMVGVETRSSSPVRILRDKTLQSNLRGLYPCGEGAGYAGGIVSAAVDGVRVAEAVAHPLLCGEIPEK